MNLRWDTADSAERRGETVIFDDIIVRDGPAGPTDAAIVVWFRELVASGRIESVAARTEAGRVLSRGGTERWPDYADQILRAGQVGNFEGVIFDEAMIRSAQAYHPDAHTVRFSEMSAEAEAELEAWDEMLHGRKSP